MGSIQQLCIERPPIRGDEAWRYESGCSGVGGDYDIDDDLFLGLMHQILWWFVSVIAKIVMAIVCENASLMQRQYKY